MKRKYLKFIIIIVILITILLLGIYIYKMNNNNIKKLENQNQINTQNESSSNIKENINKRNYAKIEDLPEEYMVEQAIKDGCIVLTYKESKNKELLQEFIKNVNNNIPDYIRILEFTVEGDQIIKDIELKEDGVIYYTVDNTRDKYMSKEDRIILKEQYNTNEYRIIEDEYKNKQNVYFENKNEDFNSRKYICTYIFDLEYNKNFNLIYERQKNLGITEILKKKEPYNYSVYSFGGDVKVEINGEKLDLKEAVLSNKISMNDIIRKCVDDELNGKVKTSEYSDGGTTIYKYENHWIIKCNTLDGSRDVFIGMPNMTYNNGTVQLST